MSSEIPEYYRHLIEQAQKKEADPVRQEPSRAEPPRSEPPRQETPRPSPPIYRPAPPKNLQQRYAPAPAPPPITTDVMAYRGNTFSMTLPRTWQDKTFYLFTGPVEDDIQHNVTLVIDEEVPVDSLDDYVDWQLMTLEVELGGFWLLKRNPTTLHNGMPAYRLIYRWAPSEHLTLYQEQLYVLHEQTGYKLAASFTKKTRKSLGPMVEQVMLSFDPSL